MKSRSKKKIIIAVSGSVIGIAICVLVTALIMLEIRTNFILNDHSSIYSDEKYQDPVLIDGIDVIKQDVSCGYAILEMYSAWTGQTITEESLYDEYGKVVTSTGQAFCDEMNRWFPAYQTTMHKYLTNTELIDKVYDNLSSGIPVPFEWAAKYGDEWTLHYSLITGIDIPNDTIVIANPYGYYEEISIGEFLERTSFEAYSDMPFYFTLAFAFGVFEKNAIFTVE